ncbi:MAG: phosphonate ABC transporter, permease protein PhnE [Acidimicrobiia bacterium]
MTTLAEPGVQVRPPAPRSARDVALPLAVYTFAIALVGLSGEAGPLWGLLIGGLTFGLFYWIGLSRSPLDAALLVISGSISYSLLSLVLISREPGVGVNNGLALRAALCITLLGLAAGWVGYRHSPGTKPTIILISAATWGGGAYLALMTAVAIGLLAPIRGVDVQQLTIGLFIAVSVSTAVLGAFTNVSFWLGKASPIAVGAVGLVTVLAWNEIGFSVSEIWTQILNIGSFIGDFWPPEFTWPKSPGQPPTFNMGGALLETFQIAIVGATVGCAIAAPLSFMASRPTSPNPTAYWISKSFLNVIRTIPDLFWAVFFATAVGFGKPFAGALAMIMFSLAIMAKLLSETVDAIDLGPLEAARAAGATHSQVIRRAAFPQILPNFVAYALYVFELNIRASVVIGFVGAGGIGRLLDERRQFFQLDQFMAIVLVIFASVLLIEAVSIFVRRRIA